jgi:UDP-glucose 4-epimerase
MKKILVIGGYGFIGSHLASSYKNDDFLIYKTSKYFDIKEDANSFQIDYSEESFTKIFVDHSFDLIFFMSGNPYPGISEKNPIYDVQETITPLVNLLSSLHKTNFKGTLWFASSVAVYGKTNQSYQSESDRCSPLSGYAIAKYTCEEYLSLFAKENNLSCGSLRIFSTFGEGLKRQVVYDLYKKAISDSETLEIFGTGNEERDLCYVKDQVDRIRILASNIKPYGDIYNIGNGTSVSSYQIAKEILKLTNIKKDITFSNSLRGFDGYQWRACTKKFSIVANNPVTEFSIALKNTLDSY